MKPCITITTKHFGHVEYLYSTVPHPLLCRERDEVLVEEQAEKEVMDVLQLLWPSEVEHENARLWLHPGNNGEFTVRGNSDTSL